VAIFQAFAYWVSQRFSSAAYARTYEKASPFGQSALSQSPTEAPSSLAQHDSLIPKNFVSLSFLVVTLPQTLASPSIS